MTYEISRGTVVPNWDDNSFKTLPYTKQPLMDYEIQEWQNKGYDYVKSFSGSMYDNRNPMPDWVDLIQLDFGLVNKTYTFYKMSTLEIMPEHVDHFTTYRNMHNVPSQNVYRVLLMLEDWKPGHYLEINKVGYVNWKKGDWFKWSANVPHAASNIGIEDRYTLQITGTSMVGLPPPKLLSFNIPDIKNYVDSNEVDYIQKNLNISTPTYVYTNNGYIQDLSVTVHSNKTVEYLNEHGLSIYLYEPCCSYDISYEPHPRKFHNKHSFGFYSEFSNNVDIANLRIEELDSIADYIEMNRLTNVTVYMCDYDIPKYYPYYNNLTIVTSDLFIDSYRIAWNPNLVKFDKTINKKFISLNWRYTKHRHWISTFLFDKDAHLSWYFKSELDTLLAETPFDIKEWIGTYPNLYETLYINNERYSDIDQCFTIDHSATSSTWIDDPYNLDIWPANTLFNKYSTPAVENCQTHASLLPYYTEAFVDIVTETRFGQPTANISEKIIQSALYKTPFILVAPPLSLKYAKEKFGIKSFNDFWDESYDEIENHGERLAAIFNIINDINAKSYEELTELYNNMMDIINYNFQSILKFIKR